MLETGVKQRNPIELTLVLLIFLALLYAAYNTLNAFFGIFTFALIFTVAFSSLFEIVASKLGGKRKLTAFIYGIVLLVIVALPFVYLVNVIGEYAHKTQVLVSNIKNNQVPPLPEWLAGLPYVGEKAKTAWAALEKDPATTLSFYEPQIRGVLQRLLQTGGGLLTTGLELVVGIIISAVLLFMGQKALRPVELFFAKLFGA
ncbi:MAG TPA: hypothetical protein VLA58_09545, partial [Chitinophagaceae bacterium]|nr:hypothetical protein [Chitinophagaceae bacterium]